jgi:hypothetical protein
MESTGCFFFFLASDWLVDTGFCHLIGVEEHCPVLVLGLTTWSLCSTYFESRKSRNRKWVTRSHVTGNDVIDSQVTGNDIMEVIACACATVSRDLFSYSSSSTKCTIAHHSKGTPFGVTWLSVTSGSPVGHAQWYILKKETRVPVAHAHTVTFVASFPVTSLPVTSFPVSWLPVTSLPAIFSYTFEVSGAKWPGGQI